MTSANPIPKTKNSPAMDGLTPAAHAEAVVQQSGTSFFWAMRTLEPAKRQGMYAIYAFCREVDDIADDQGQVAEKLSALKAWRDDIDLLFNGGVPTSLTGQALKPVIEAYGCRQADFHAVIDGMVTDAEPMVRIADEAGLYEYCDRVASAVGRLSNRVFGIDNDQGDPIADALGQALQRTNILRDIVEDADRDRLYIPKSLLEKHGLTSSSLDDVLKSQALKDVAELLASDTEERYRNARKLLAACDPAVMRPAMVMMEVYSRVFNRLKQRGWDDLQKPVGLSKLEKLWVGLRFGLFGG